MQPAGLEPLSLQQERFKEFVHEYNWQRPHQALGQQPPASWYGASPRPYPSVLEDPDYPDEALIRRVRSNGEIKWRGGRVFISEALTAEAVAIVEGLLGYEVSFGPIHLGQLDAAGERLLRPGGLGTR